VEASVTFKRFDAEPGVKWTVGFGCNLSVVGRRLRFDSSRCHTSPLQTRLTRRSSRPLRAQGRCDFRHSTRACGGLAACRWATLVHIPNNKADAPPPQHVGFAPHRPARSPAIPPTLAYRMPPGSASPPRPQSLLQSTKSRVWPGSLRRANANATANAHPATPPGPGC
jgi:hypothetical protein